ncbi:MAG: uroporphyrinogen-III synthase [Arenimonas sp.]|nr:uroporphyrinogen-III synthase [Arenimonas sp.]
MSKQQLIDWTIISLRPQGQHASIRLAVAQWHAKCLAFSIYKLVALANPHALSKALASDLRIMSSPSAVHFACKLASLSGQWLAVGQQTAKALYDAGASSVIVAEPQTADGLLQLAQLQSIQGVSVGLVSAPHGRGLLEQTLAERGAHLHIALVYRRQALQLTAKQLARIDQLSVNTALLVSSQRAFEHFWQQLSEPRKAIIKSAICIVSSTRLLEYLQSLGLSRIVCSGSTLAQIQMSTLANTVLPSK